MTDRKRPKRRPDTTGEPAGPAPEPSPPDARPEPQAPQAAPPAAQPSPEQRLAALNDKYRRAVADLANAHKRFQQERERISKLVTAGFVARILPVIDNMSHSLRSAQASHDAAALIEGFKLIEAQMLQIFSDNGIQPIESVGKPFDPEVHHAVTTDVTELVPPGTVTEELGRGFILDGVVVRPAQVKVAARPPQPEPQGPAGDEPKPEKN